MLDHAFGDTRAELFLDFYANVEEERITGPTTQKQARKKETTQ